MNNPTIHEILIEMNESNSSNYKKEVLEKHKDNLVWQSILKYTYNTALNYFINKTPDYSSESISLYDFSNNQTTLDLISSVNDIEDIFPILDLLSSGDVRGHKGLEIVRQVLIKLSEENKVIFLNIIGRDLKAGVSTTTLNKIYDDNFIYKTPYLGCQQFNAKKIRAILERDGKIYSDVKNDGRYANAILVDGHNVELVSRQGKDSSVLGRFYRELKELQVEMGEDFVLNGELMVEGYDRLAGNAIVARCITINQNIDNGELKKAETSKKKLLKEFDETFEELQDKIYQIVWDIIPYDKYLVRRDETPREERLENLSKMFEVVNKLNIKSVVMQEFSIIEVEGFNEEISKLLQNSKTAKTIDKTTVEFIEFQKNIDIAYGKVMNHLKEMLERGEEGTVLKSFPCIWREGKKEEQFKGKIEFECELEIIGYREGKVGTKYEGKLGSLECQSLNGTIVCNVSGIEEVAKNKDLSRDDFWNNKDYYLGKIITIKCNGISTNKDGDKNFFYPNYVKLRDDKTQADSLEDILAIESAILEVEKDLN